MEKTEKATHYSVNELITFLDKKASYSREEIRSVKDHLDFCRDCWDKWNIVRWDRALGSKGVEELKQFLGESYVEYFDSSWALAEEWNSEPRDTQEAIEKFYKNTSNYLYNSLIFFESGDREDMSEDMDTILSLHNIRTVLDYGAGVGNDSLRFLERGLEVYNADFDSPASDFLKFRAIQRGLDRKLHFVDVIGKDIPEVELIWTIDTLEHMIDPYKILEYVTDETKVFAYFIDDDTDAGGRHPFHTEFKHGEFNQMLREKGFKQIDSLKLSSWSKVWSR